MYRKLEGACLKLLKGSSRLVRLFYIALFLLTAFWRCVARLPTSAYRPASDAFECSHAPRPLASAAGLYNQL